VIEIAKAVSLDSIGNDRKQQMAALDEQAPIVEIRFASVHVIPEIETAQMRDLVPRDVLVEARPLRRFSASHQAACLARSGAAGEVLPSLMR